MDRGPESEEDTQPVEVAGSPDPGPEPPTDAAEASAIESPETAPISRPPSAHSQPPSAPNQELGLIAAARMQAQRRAAPVSAGPVGNIPGYTVIRELHRGGQGVVYLATQEGTGRQVAIKVMRQGPFSTGNDRVRFDREVRILAQLNNPNIVAIHDSGAVRGNFYYVMDYVAGSELDDYVTDNDLPIKETLALFCTICHAVNAAHLRGVIHRDLKPSNIRVTPTGDPRVLDFGLAKVSSPSETGETVTGASRIHASRAAGAADLPTQMTITGQFVGSLPWASPEQARGDASRIDVRTDVYSLGVMLYQLLCARFPYAIDGPMREVMANICDADPLPPRKARPDITRDLEMLVLKPLAKRADDRYQTAGDFARDIERFLAGEPIEAKRGSGQYLLRKLIQRNWGKAAVAAGLLALILAGLVGLSAGYVELAKQEETWDAERVELRSEIDRLQRDNDRLRIERDEAIRGFIDDR